ncbi:MAG: hypothetical protein ITD36_00410 [Nitrospira sp.]|nr:hypothetical protein [Nitrospira sp.]MBP0130076.1 hypothetical protein [Nitrospira sp.]GBL39669.1 hypothetical protein EMGBD2_09270 [Nitrospirota bacterium]GDX89161.1 hypothetical protein LBMAG45_10170 [Nitrospirota bacterium]
MSATQSFWSVSQRAGEPAYRVCMSCLSEVFYLKVPMPDCPTCHGVSTYEAFTLEAIRDWGTEDLIAKAGIAQQEASLEPGPAASVKSVD